jgi:NAD(P)-dependent dehydrogenase (short-subunit alcohol dehydrogenase family)
MRGQQKSVFITGAAAGIGRATALTFARQGFTVGGYDIDEVGLKTLADEIDQLGATGSNVAGRAAPAIVGHLDVTDPDEMAQRVGEFANAAGGRLDVMINNAGILRAGRFEEMDIAGHLREKPTCRPHRRSTVRPKLANYSATKFFVRGITEALDLEWERYGIRVIAMWPLYVQTAMTENLATGTTESLGIRLTAQEIADAIVAATEPSKLRRAIHQVHFPVGSQSKALAAGSRFSPGWLTRLVNKRLAHS